MRTQDNNSSALGNTQALIDRITQLEIENSKLRTLADRDGLTGCLRREAFMTLIERRRSFGLLPKEMTLAVVDIDHFKKVNDTYGHLAGDQVLSQMSQILLESAPEGTLVCRMGGEEFVLLIPMHLEEAVRGLDKLREMISSANIKVSQPNSDSHEVMSIHVTASFGTATWDTDRALVEVTARADAALYKAKKAGRNQVQVAA